jgi:hypothetical protein
MTTPNFSDTEWAMIANALRVCATANSTESGDDSAFWIEQAARERALAECIETEMGV